MNKILAATAASTLFAFSGAAFAADSESGLILGIKEGRFSSQQESVRNKEAPALQLGYRFNSQLSLEAEYLKAKNGDVSNSYTTPAVSGHYNMESESVFVAYRTSDPLYLKLKLGAYHQKLDIQYANGTSPSYTRDGGAYGGGVGVKFHRCAIELEATHLVADKPSDYVSLGFNYTF